MGKSQRDKGKRGEREAAKVLSNLLGVDVTRSQQYKGNAGAADLDSPLGLHFEVKRTERLNLYDAMEQADDDAGEGVNARVMHEFRPGDYTVRVTSHDARVPTKSVRFHLSATQLSDF